MKIPNHKIDEWEAVPTVTRFSRKPKGGAKKPDEAERAREAYHHQQPAAV